MNNINKFNKYSKTLLAKNNLVCKDAKIIALLSTYINYIVYNITTLNCIILLLIFDSNQLRENTLSLTNNYLNKMCPMGKSKMKGGMSMPSEYFGVDSGRYSSSEGSDVQLVDFEKGILRQQLGGCNNCSFNTLLKTSVSKVLKQHKVKASPDVKQILVNCIKKYIYRMFKIIKSKKELKYQYVKSKIMKSCLKKIIK
tara:strand:- start:5303 stop:5896 length:594 start_codon:yes stop_codon:yes gene_type:complete